MLHKLFVACIIIVVYTFDMETLGWIALGLVGVIGLILTLLAVFEYLAIQFSLFCSKVGKEVEVRKEHVNAKGEAKKQRLAKKREVQAKIADRVMQLRIDKMKIKANEKFGEEFFETKKEASVKEKKAVEKPMEPILEKPILENAED